ncbi:MAG: rhamnulokinase [Lachnospiraceae bacterium]|jgi:rhamnulokinase
MSDNYILVDLGASNGRVIVANVAEGKFDFDVIHRFDNVPVFCNEGDFCWDILRIFGEVKDGIRLALDKYPDARSVAVDSWGCDFGFIDEQGRLLGNPLHYRDEAQYKIIKEFHSIISEEEMNQLTQTPCSGIMGGYKLYQLMKNDRFEYKYGKKLLMIPDIINYMLTGVVANEFCNATMTMLADQKTRKWSEEVLDRFGFRKDIFTELSEPGTVLGPIKESVCVEKGIKSIPVVLTASHDTAAAVAGIPVTQTDKKWGFVSLGTWALAGLERPEPVIDPELTAFELGNEGGTFGTTMLLKNINGLWLIQQCRNRWKYELGRDISWGEIIQAAIDAEDHDCVFDCDAEVFMGAPASMPRAIQEFMEKTGQYVPQTMGEIARCVYKNLALRIAYTFRKIGAVINEEVELLHLIGGGTQTKLLCQWISSTVGVPVTAGPTETTAVGNLIFQLLADGKISSLEEGRALSAASSELDHYEPQDKEYWDKAMEYYVKTLGLE